MIRNLCLLTALVLLAGCTISPVRVYMLDHETNSTPRAEIDVYDSVDAVQKPYSNLAAITSADKRGVRFSEPEMRRLIIDKAREIGADAVIINSLKTRRKVIPDGMGGYATYDQVQADALAVIYTNE